MIDVIFLDMDGVLFNFPKASCDLHGFDLDTVLSNWKEHDDNGKNIKDKLEKQLGISSKEFWSKIHENSHSFWKNMPKYEWADKLVELCFEYSDNVEILTSPGHDYHSPSGKREAVRRNFPTLFRYTNIVKNKFRLANPTAVLIDDTEDKLDPFIERGGQGILFPQIWNRNDFVDDKLDYIESCLRDLA